MHHRTSRNWAAATRRGRPSPLSRPGGRCCGGSRRLGCRRCRCRCRNSPCRRWGSRCRNFDGGGCRRFGGKIDADGFLFRLHLGCFRGCGRCCAGRIGRCGFGHKKCVVLRWRQRTDGGKTCQSLSDAAMVASRGAVHRIQGKRFAGRSRGDVDLRTAWSPPFLPAATRPFCSAIPDSRVLSGHCGLGNFLLDLVIQHLSKHIFDGI
jgi:hypothetical protein